MSANLLFGSIASAVTEAGNVVRGIFRRVLVHIGAITTAAVISSLSAGNPTIDYFGYGISFFIYLGLICLFPRGMGPNGAWVIPTGLGVVQLVTLAVLGIPWQLAIFWGGFQTWLQRCLGNKGNIGWEWSVLPFLGIFVFMYLNDARDVGIPFLPLWTVPVLAVVGLLIQRVYQYRRQIPIHRGLINNAVRRLQRAGATYKLPEPFKEPLGLITEQGTRYLALNPSLGTTGFTLAREMDAVSKAVENLVNRTNPNKWDERAGRIYSSLGALSDRMKDEITALTPARPAHRLSSEEEFNARLEGYLEQARALVAKKEGLPRELRPRLDGISKATGNIVECMRTDPEDRAPGDKFLSRYLDAAHKVVDEHIRLARDGVGHKGVREALDRSGELIARLESAFINEHASLLRNDTINFTAELNVLDKILTMQGR